ncbi:MAG: hypothetical protein DMD35_18665, partial [Gemmatimonadetes bacterium]
MINQDAKSYFVNSSGQNVDRVFALIDAMSAASKTTAGATSAGFEVLRRYGEAAHTAAIKSTTTDDNLSVAANHVLLCMSVPGFAYSELQFSSAFSVTGLFAVRADTEARPVVARSGLYGAEPTSGNWPLGGS